MGGGGGGGGQICSQVNCPFNDFAGHKLEPIVLLQPSQLAIKTHDCGMTIIYS